MEFEPLSPEMKMHYTPITPKVRTEVFLAWDNTCAYCKVRPAQHCDHIYPKAKGGEDCLENYAAACETCNFMKSDMILGDGILHMIQAFAKNKAPKISARLSPKKTSQDKSLVLKALVEAAQKYQKVAKAEKSDDIDTRLQAQFGPLSISDIKKETSRLNKERRALERFENLKPWRDELEQLLVESGDPRETIQRVMDGHQTSTAVVLKKAISAQKRRLKPIQNQTVTFSFSIEDAETILGILKQALQDDDTYQNVFIKKEQAPKIHRRFSTQYDIFDLTGAWQGQNFGKRLLYVAGTDDTGFTLYAHPDAIFFLQEALDLQTMSLRYTGTHDHKRPSRDQYVQSECADL